MRKPDSASIKGALRPLLDVNKVAARRPGWGHAAKDPKLAAASRNLWALGGMPRLASPMPIRR